MRRILVLISILVFCGVCFGQPPGSLWPVRYASDPWCAPGLTYFSGLMGDLNIAAGCYTVEQQKEISRLFWKYLPQDPPKVPETKPAATIPIPAPEAAQLKALEAEFNKLQTEFQQKLKDLQAQWNLTTTRAAVRAKLPIEQLDSLTVQPDNNGGYIWAPKQQAKTDPPKTPNN